MVPDPVLALDRAVEPSRRREAVRPRVAEIEFLGNYTAFAELRDRL